MNFGSASRACVWGAVLVASWFQPVAAAPLEIYGQLPSLEDVALSPDGSRMAFVRTSGNARVVAVMTLADRKTIGAVQVGDTKLRWVQWIDNDHLALTVSMATIPNGMGWTTLGEFFQLLIYDLPRQRVRNPLDSGRGLTLHGGPAFANFIAGSPMVRLVNGQSRLYVQGYIQSDGYVQGLFEIDPADASARLKEKGTESLGFDWLVDDHGEVAAQEVYHNHADDQRWSFRVRIAGMLRETLAGHEGVDIPRMLGFAPDAASVWVRRLEGGIPVVRPLLLADGKFGEPIASAAEFNGVERARATDRVIGGTLTNDSSDMVFLDTHRQSQWRGVVASFPGDLVSYISAADDFSRVVVKLTGPHDPLTYMLVDLQSNVATSLGPAYKGLDAVAEKRAISYPAADGLTIPAFLTLPPNRPVKGLPLVVLPHGGPEDHEEPGFDYWAQALAAQGYAVLQPNFRGSDLTQKLLAAGYGEWGRKMQTDLSDGVRFLVASGSVDPKRVCIDGGSYGGYAALAAVAFEPGVYRCAISVAGISDLRTFFADRLGGLNNEEDVSERFWSRYMGINNVRDPALDAISPVLHVEAITAPVMLIHGRDDTVVPFRQSELMRNALKKAGKPVELVELKKEDHWMSRSETRLQVLEATVAFLKAHNPPD